MDTQELNYYFNKFKYGEDCYHYLMANKVREILLVSTFYDAFIFEQDGRLSEQIFGEYRQLNLSTAPIITSVPTGEDALRLLEERQFDLVITMPRIGSMTPFDLAQKIKTRYPDLPILLLLNMLSDLPLTNPNEGRLKYFDNVFLWNGDTKLFLAMVKSVEDKRNLAFDTKIGLVRVILLVEDNVQFYSIFLPLLYEEIVKQTQILISEELNDINKRLRMRARPKVVLTHTYEEAMEIYTQYQEFIIAVISDIAYLHEGKIDNEAGIKLISKVKENIYDVPTILLSSDSQNYEKAVAIRSTFIHKKSKHLLQQLRDFIKNNLGFGDFIFRNGSGQEIDRAHTLAEFEEKLKNIPDESIIFHSRRNHFSAWLMARGETQIARQIRLLTVNDFPSTADIRQHLLGILHAIRLARHKGKIVNFSPQFLFENTQIVRLAEGSLGGKGRGLAFLNALLVTMEFEKFFTTARITLPATAVIGTNEYDEFLTHNQIYNHNLEYLSDQTIDQLFLNGELSPDLCHKLRLFLDKVTYPLAVRSSGLLEDSYSQPFAGIYRTYMLPNNHPDINVRFQQLQDAIKLVFASVFLKSARTYIENLNHQVEEEQMAVIIQEFVGTNFQDQFCYPHISGVAQSYNFYPITGLKNSDGIAQIAIGLGRIVIEGKKIFRFCPRYPTVELIPPTSLLGNSQTTLDALDLRKKSFDLLSGDDVTITELPIKVAEEHGALDQIASVWDFHDNRLVPDLNISGPRVIAFEKILKYNSFPLASILERLLDIGEKAFGTPIEIEFAVKLSQAQSETPPTFYILQIRPLSLSDEDIAIETKELEQSNLLLYTETALGNGTIEGIQDIVFIAPDTFDKLKTPEIQAEVEQLNQHLTEQNRGYLLIGPGRWGSRDPFLGIPVKFAQINHARAIVEIGLPDFDIDPSQGTHFFHNIVALRIAYFNIPYNNKRAFLDWEWLKSLPIERQLKYTAHVRSATPLTIKINGKTGVGVIIK
jgi:CheY-like chemotaxis protein